MRALHFLVLAAALGCDVVFELKVDAPVAKQPSALAVLEAAVRDAAPLRSASLRGGVHVNATVVRARRAYVAAARAHEARLWNRIALLYEMDFPPHPMEAALWRLRHACRADGWVSVPIPWHYVADPNHAGKRQKRLAAAVLSIWKSLEVERFPHHTVMVQSHLEQVRAVFSGAAPPDFSRVVVFDTRWTSLGPLRLPRGTELAGAARARVPVPLLHGEEARGRERRRQRTAKATHLFWAGGCHARVRCGLRALGGGVRACGDRLDENTYGAAVDGAVWALAPRGTTHATFALAEALRSRALPIYVSDGSSVCVSRETCCGEGRRPLERRTLDVAARLPFADIGLDYARLGLVVDSADVSELPARIAAAEADLDGLVGRRNFLDAARPLFTPRGVAAYVAYKLTFCLADLGVFNKLA